MWRRFSCIVVSVLALVMYSNIVLAQCDEVPNPGNPDDPGYDPNGCPVPLDTWVFILVAIGLVYTVYILHKKQKSLSA
ncbi:hypothetical protein [Mucilaginibacter gilvus]|uniref:Signal peptidase n=1 Tax=Mucilaginibacter gilvus TaxID=2305909 RepID=A0A3S3V8F0_9SPHI|nr:hypothetical protein [Mucilaginibacter gilvus]RWY47873.1 hypothetical protein EPL05_19975 [Mucilaginibacter gilvus]